MNANDSRYTDFGLCKDMLDTPGIVRGFDCDQTAVAAAGVKAAGKLHMTGEGSSRIFPAKHAMKVARQRGYAAALHTDAGCQSQSYGLADWAVMGMSNSGRTAEVIQLFKQLKEAGHDKLYSLAAFADSKLASFANQEYVLQCGEEGAVAATKSVVEQALFYQALLEEAQGDKSLAGHLGALADAMDAALTVDIPDEVTQAIAGSPIIYWAGPNDGVAEELTLKTNEITRKPSDYLEGTYAAHGIEEVMSDKDVVLWIDPIEDQEAKFEDVLVKGVGVTIVAVSDRETRFPTIQVPTLAPGKGGGATDLMGYVYMAAGWNVLVEVGTSLGINIDKPERARKVGNEFVG
ncbi:SIS domain-containing protein [Phycisphaeraceae bacterium D3-23]